MSYASQPDANTSAPSYVAPYPPQPYQAYPVAAGTSASGSGEPTSTRRADELARKDRTLAEFMLMLDEYDSLIPNEVTDYYLQRAGFECEDVRLKRLLSLAAQKFVSDIAADAYQHARIRTNAQPAARARTDKAGGTAAASALARDKTRTVLTMDDLSAALAEYGISARKPDFYL
ncbi:Transcription initiation factor TFIID subunit 10 [Ceratobasidium sp. 414]|nr:Transcription initiation factor TFIID subunit 10 [Ceratobasidium sp. 414]